ncbi:MAG TPA: YihY/virulence factor BrkB family protein [Gemmatimonadaceae bacterium]|nr:YihY/virulence factor BrkB family protein [Gemmatimonadaceae bacterium]
MLNILKAAWNGFNEDECGTRAAALSYSTIFALPPLLILLVTIAGKVWGPDKVQKSLEGQFSGMVGPDAAQQIHGMISHGMNSMGGGTVATILGIVGLLLGATGAFLSLQDALNKAWNVEPDPKQGGIKNFLMKRLFSIGMVLGLGFLVAASLALSALIASFSALFGGLEAVAFAIDLIVSLGVLTALFAALFKVLPDARVDWRDVWHGGFFTAVLFVVGKFVIGLYLGHSNPGSSFGAASALAILIVWLYYAGMIVLFGAEFTQAWATERGAGVEPKKGAVRIVEREVRIGSEGAVPVMAKERAVATSGNAKAADAPSKGSGGIGDWIIGLPALYWMMRRRDKNPRP